VGLGLAVVATTGLAVVAWRRAAGWPGDRQRHDRGLGAGWRAGLDPGLAARLRPQPAAPRILFGRSSCADATSSEWPTSGTATPAGAANLLDVYRRRSHPSDGPRLIHLHGGAFVGGRKDRERGPLIYRLASQGWLCISANYRLSPAAAFPDHLIDVKKVIAWVREHGPEYGGDPAVVFVAGSFGPVATWPPWRP
jgi:acetyl esterase/lipase